MRTNQHPVVTTHRIADWLWCGLHLARWLPTWKRYDPDYRPRDAAPVFVSARTAAAMIPDGAVVAGAGLGAHGRASTLYFAIRDRYRARRHPAGLTWIHCGGAGGRGRLPGTLDDLAEPGLLDTVITAHTQTVPALRHLGAAGDLRLHLLPQGVLSLLIEAQAQGVSTQRTSVGVGTFMDTRVGPGSALCPGSGRSLAEPDGDALRYRLPLIDVGLFFAPWADREGNVYFEGAACLTEMHDIAMAARANGGKVVVMVAGILSDSERPCAPALPASAIDAIVVSRRGEQTASVPQLRQWNCFLPGTDPGTRRMLDRIDILDRILGTAPARGRADHAVARLAATLLLAHIRRGEIVNIGTGLPEVVARVLADSDAADEFCFSLESGVLGGIPAPGGMFGAALSPRSLHSSSWMFHRYRTDLAVACLGMLEFDRDGNVNVSRTEPGVANSIGPGGFIDITDGARTIIFVGSWRHGGSCEVNGGRIRIKPVGSPKLVARVREITFNGRIARRRGKTVYYVTTVGAFRLDEHGLTLTHIMPGIDIARDILTVDPTIAVPVGGPIRIGSEITTGQGFRLPDHLPPPEIGRATSGPAEQVESGPSPVIAGSPEPRP
ncbi:CoA-transferase [Nocardia pseudobrasiliensis]|uniref:Propionate CoA-transferase n=1 Tax=Nocardia pseudobrasiliensis TaxID=45979 RepID=A0A370IFV3_9NOCA|nr:CoA-transferase [Nocardia pseudobrasiliensis]RDI68334.1 propionate CoA-transferase [Nocardia pseudobrasiliensis]